MANLAGGVLRCPAAKDLGERPSAANDSWCGISLGGVEEDTQGAPIMVEDDDG
jgi:hypothetical protein